MQQVINSALMSRLSTFRPSDRKELDRVLSDVSERETALEAVKQFIRGWENADWLEAYSIERIGKWIGKYQTEAVQAELSKWAQKKQTDAREAFLRGLKEGNAVRELEHA